MAEYIEREAVVKRLEEAREWCEKCLGEGKFKEGCIAALDDEIFNIQRRKLVPSVDVVEVVRCKDCNLFVNNEKALVTYCTRECKNLTVKPDDYCSYGIKKEGAEE